MDPDPIDHVEERLARGDLAAAQASERGEEFARQRFWRLHVKAAKLGHTRWAAAFLARLQLAEAHGREARVAVHAAVEQIEKVGERRRAERADGKLRGRKTAAFERDLERVIEAFSRVEQAAKKMKKGAAVEQELDMSLTTYRNYVAKARRLGRLS